MTGKFHFKNGKCDEKEVMGFLQWVVGLYQLGQQHEVIDESRIYHNILSHIVEAYDADTGSLALLEESGESLCLVAGIDLPDGVVGSSVQVSDSRMGEIIRSVQSSLFNDETPERISRVSSAMCWPICISDKVIGALNINRGKQREAYTQKNLDEGQVIVDLISVVLENMSLHKESQGKICQLENINAEMKAMNHELESAKSQLLQSEKLASIGQLAAGVAHEINNPVGFINSNLGSLGRYLEDLFRLLDTYEKEVAKMGSESELQAIVQLKNEIDMEYLRDDIAELMAESQEGVSRVKQIVQDLKDFSHVNESDWQHADIHSGIDSTLNVARNEIKYKAEVIKEYGSIPQIECMPSQLNQVFMNLIVNAAHAIKDKGLITIRSGEAADKIWVSVEDNGQGMSDEVKGHIFEPFYTTKDVGKGTGLGLSLSYGIIEKHGGSIEVESECGVGTCFTVWLPVHQTGEHEQEKQAGVVG